MRGQPWDQSSSDDELLDELDELLDDELLDEFELLFDDELLDELLFELEFELLFEFDPPRRPRRLSSSSSSRLR